MVVKEDEVVNAIRWRLGIPVDSNVARSQQIWEQLRSSTDPGIRAQMDRVSRFLADVMERVVRWRLDLPDGRVSAGDGEFLDTLWFAVADWLQADPMKRSPRINGLIREALAGKRPEILLEALPACQAPPPLPRRSSAPVTQPINRQVLVQPPPQPRSEPVRPVAPPPVCTPLPTPTPAVDKTQSDSRRVAGSRWLYRPVPAQEPDPHTEFCCESVIAREGERLLGARVRGKKHKHEGTNCDDWFEMRISGPWTVVAVADGAGSRKFSRVGAKASCVRAVETLAAALEKHIIADCPDANGLTLKNEGIFLHPAVELVQQSLHQAILTAAAAVEEEARVRANDPSITRLLGRTITPDDLAATLMLVVSMSVKIGAGEQNLVVGCQIGDGVISVMTPGGRVALLGEPDSGDYSGETDFLTSLRQRESANLQRKTFALVGPVHVLLVMTDGVADDYFPADPGMARLYADLVLNGILPPSGTDAAKGPALAEEPASAPPEVDSRLIDTEVELLVGPGEEPRSVLLRSAALYASELGVPVERLAALPVWLQAGTRDTPLAQRADSPEERLRLWLDAYQVRGSFDDRTLVVLHCERPS